MKKIILTLLTLASVGTAEDLTVCNPVSRYSLKDRVVGSITLRCPAGQFMGAVACSSELYRIPGEVTLLSSNSARCDYELQVENDIEDFDYDGELTTQPIINDRAKLQINCCTR